MTPAPIERETLATLEVEVLSRGGWGNPDVLLVQASEGAIVVKDFAPRTRWVRCSFGPWLLRREMRAYRALAGVSAVPRLLGAVDPLAIALEYRPGRPLGRDLARSLPASFADDLRAAVQEMHGRGVLHLDLRHHSNVLADDRQRPVLLDFASALCLRPGGLAARWLLPLLAWIDRRALHKWERRLAAGQRESSPAADSPSAEAGGSAGSRGARRPM